MTVRSTSSLKAGSGRRLLDAEPGRRFVVWPSRDVETVESGRLRVGVGYLGVVERKGSDLVFRTKDASGETLTLRLAPMVVKVLRAAPERRLHAPAFARARLSDAFVDAGLNGA